MIIPLGGGIHGGTFIWRGDFGELEVANTGWASKPKGRQLRQQTAAGQAIFRERGENGEFVIAIWNCDKGAAYFQSPRRFTRAQKDAIGRTALFNEGERPEGCTYRTIFAWDLEAEDTEASGQ